MILYKDFIKEKVNNEIKVKSAEGYPCVFDNSKGRPLKDYKLYGNSIQDGTPAPESPVEVQSIGDLVTDAESEYYGKYDIPVKVCGKNLLPNSDWMSGAHVDGFSEQVTKDYITEYTINSISFNLPAWTGVSSPRFLKGSVKRIVFKINQNQINSNDGYINFYIIIQGYDDNNNKIGNKIIYNSAIADKEYVFNISAITSYSWYAKSTQFSFCIVARKNNLSNLMVYDIAYYAKTDTTVYEPYIEETTHIYLDEPLRKVGDYADYIDFKHQKVVRNIFKHSLNTGFSIYRKLNNVIRFVADGPFGKCDYHIRSTIFGNYSGFSNDKETVFHHPTSMYAFYWSVYWHRLGLTYDGTNVYRTDDTEQTSLTDSEIKNITKKWLNTLSDKDREVYIILGTPTEKSTTLPALKTFKGTNIISVDTNISPSNIQVQYIER